LFPALVGIIWPPMAAEWRSVAPPVAGQPMRDVAARAMMRGSAFPAVTQGLPLLSTLAGQGAHAAAADLPAGPASSALRGVWGGARVGIAAAAFAVASRRGALRLRIRRNAAAEGSSSGRQEEVLQQLRAVSDPELGVDIVKLGFVKDLMVDEKEGLVVFRLEVAAYADRAKAEVAKLPWVKGVEVQGVGAPSRPPPPAADAQRPMPRMPASLDKVKSIIAVSSCKGGVGKSTVAVNLAYALQKQGAKVGIFDCDVYGPSLPVMVRIPGDPQMTMYEDDEKVKHIVPVTDPNTGMKLVSFGYAGKAAVMRGSMVTGLISQFIQQTDWGDLDYLVLDMPPGTGDIHLTLAQVCKITAAVIVTTPQKLSVIDVERGISMFSQLEVPSVAVVQNMSYIELPTGDRTYPFGNTNSGRAIADTFGIDHVFEMPLDPKVAECGDGGTPFVVSSSDSPAAAEVEALAKAVKAEVDEILSGTRRPAVTYDAGRDLLRIALPDGEIFGIEPAVLRLRDKGAGGVTPLAGDVHPAEIREMGNYAIVIRWSDGLVQVAPHRQLLEGDEKGPMPRVAIDNIAVA